MSHTPAAGQFRGVSYTPGTRLTAATRAALSPWVQPCRKTPPSFMFAKSSLWLGSLLTGVN